MLRCKKITVHTIVICTVFTFVLNMGVSNCAILRDNFPTMLFNDIAGDLILSPSSLRRTLGVTYLGSNGETADEMHRTMNLYGNKKDDTVQIKSEEYVSQTFIYVNKSLELAPEYKRQVTDAAQASTMSIDLSDIANAQQQILDLIKMKAQNLTLNTFYDSFTDPATTAVMVNTLNFENEWDKPFKGGYTINNISMMHLEGSFLYGEVQTLNAKALVLRFKNTGAYMLLLLPNEDGSQSDVRRKLSHIYLPSILRILKKTDVNVFLPDFDIRQAHLFDSRLKEMNIKQAFGTKANFTSMFKGKESSYIHEVEQSGRIKFDTRGVSLQSATVLQLRLSSQYYEITGLYRMPYSEGNKSSESLQDFNANEKPTGNSKDFIAVEPFIYAIFDYRSVMAMGVIRPKYTRI